jgi:hypothetical protein
MAQFIKPPGYGEPNFRPSKEEREFARRNRKSSAQRREGNDEKHLAIIRKCPCVACLTTKGKIDPHHLVAGRAVTKGGRVFGRRAVDAYTVPVCRVDHEIAQRAQGARELDLFQSWGFANVYDLAEALYDAPRDVTIYTNIILAHRQVQK